VQKQIISASLTGGYHHDHDGELGMYFYPDQSTTTESGSAISNALQTPTPEAPSTLPDNSRPTPPPSLDAALKSLGEHIRELRLANELTQAELASQCGLDRSFISDLEAGRVNPTYLHLRTLAQMLGLPLASLIDFKTP
jgi:ribosome-binding protein aMBF1 (putative translation factor)